MKDDSARSTRINTMRTECNRIHILISAHPGSTYLELKELHPNGKFLTREYSYFYILFLEGYIEERVVGNERRWYPVTLSEYSL